MLELHTFNVLKLMGACNLFPKYEVVKMILQNVYSTGVNIMFQNTVFNEPETFRELQHYSYFSFLLTYKASGVLWKDLVELNRVSENTNRMLRSASLVTNFITRYGFMGISVFAMFTWKNNNKMREMIEL